MGKIIISTNVTLDGVVQDPDGEEGFERGGWFHQYVGAKDLEDWVARETEEALGVDALLMGRQTSEWFADRMTARNEAEGRVSPEWANRGEASPSTSCPRLWKIRGGATSRSWAAMRSRRFRS